ncbi:MAG: phospho-N-acetylmuramoyl-pentapeptide-transferase [Armatimonadetes bacterium]|nr:phospho-N-acetylmuramoyl-pentapeptide-transferase [Armatimonadota bacterium]
MLNDFLMVSGMFIAALVLAAVGTWVVRGWARRIGLGQTVRDDGPQSHLAKMGTPTLGGLGMLVPIALLTGVWWLARGKGLSPAVPLSVGLALLFAAVGFADDWSKLRYKRPLGLKARARLPLEFVLAAVFAYALIQMKVVTPAGGLAQIIPLGAGLGFILFAMFVLVGCGNAVNLTDGLDGLAGGVSLFCALSLGAACWLLGHHDLAILCAIVAGAAAGFLWLNAPKASIFMGDVGSLGLGAILAAVAVAARLEVLLGVFGVVFVVEALSVAIQVIYFKASGGKRVFRMAPYHHHLELGGMAETKIVVRFWLITIVAGAAGLGLVAAMVLGT